MWCYVVLHVSLLCLRMLPVHALVMVVAGTIVSLLTRLYDLVRERENNPDQGDPTHHTTHQPHPPCPTVNAIASSFCIVAGCFVSSLHIPMFVYGHIVN